jgi:S-adenosylmethionine:tRNA ribosyltransferase-isomerase
MGGGRVKTLDLQFERPRALQATRPPEARGLQRDEVRLLVSTPEGHAHFEFGDLDRFLRPGDLVVVNESATLPASVPADGMLLNVSTQYSSRLWLVEPRLNASTPGGLHLEPGTRVRAGGVDVMLVARYPGLERLWFAEGDLATAMTSSGRPIRYGYLDGSYPLEAYQTIFAGGGRGGSTASAASVVRTPLLVGPGSAEMPSAGRPFSQRVLAGLRARGVGIASVVLHTGVSSHELETAEVEHQPLPPEPFFVPASTADAVNAAHTRGSRVIAVGTTVARALESAFDDGHLRAARGFTRHFIHPGSGVHTFDGLITGLHDPVTSHLALLHALAGADMIRSAYDEAVREAYLWHEFGDSHLILTR